MTSLCWPWPLPILADAPPPHRRSRLATPWLVWGLAFPILLVLAVPLAAAQGSATSPEVAEPMVPSHDGRFVISVPNRMAWARCVEGMQWNGKACTGRALRLTFNQAQARASARASEDKLPWRLPTVLELQRVVNRTAQPPGPDMRLFPAAPLEKHWTSTLLVKNKHINVYDYDNVVRGETEAREGTEIDFLHGWAVDLSNGTAIKGVPKAEKLPVRLVWAIDNKPN